MDRLGQEETRDNVESVCTNGGTLVRKVVNASREYFHVVAQKYKRYRYPQSKRSARHEFQNQCG